MLALLPFSYLAEIISHGYDAKFDKDSKMLVRM
jgi:hypothetical protein